MARHLSPDNRARAPARTLGIGRMRGGRVVGLIAGCFGLLVVGMTAVPLLALAASQSSRPASPSLLADVGVPARALSAYHAAAQRCDGLRWELLAGIGWVESRHGSDGGAVVNAKSGESTPWIFGPPLDGTNRTLALPLEQWAGWWGLGGKWQRAVGPMQILPSTFSATSVDGDGDGLLNPHDLDDAAATAARYLCGEAGQMTDERSALLRYNTSEAYVSEVLEHADRLATSGNALDGSWLCPVAGPTSFTDTWGAPRSGGRRHQGVDMFAAAGTPVVAPVAGLVEHYDDSLGGLSFRLWGDDGTYYYGTHLAAYGTSGTVLAGTVVGYVGDSGNARGTNAHLHFEAHPGRRPGDPPRPVNPTGSVASHCASNRIGVGFEGGQ